MRRRVAVVVSVMAMVLAMAGPAAADVHLVAQAACAPDGVESGAIASRHAIDHGRPAAPIMVNAGQTPEPFPGAVNSNASPQGTNCP